MKRNITFHYDITTVSLSVAEALLGRQRKLRRLPHIFSKILELPFNADADVEIQEDSDRFQFVVATDEFAGEVGAHAVEIHPGVTKVVIRSGELLLDDLQIDRWRFRLPASTKPELARAMYVDGELIVTVPKGAVSEESGVEGVSGDLRGSGNCRLVTVL